MIVLSPGSEVDTVIAPVCSGGKLELICTTGAKFLQWSYISPISGAQRNLYLIDSVTPALVPHIQTVKSSTFNVSRITPNNALPLMSRLLIGPANDNLNGTVVICQEVGTTNSSSTVINIIQDDFLGTSL